MRGENPVMTVPIIRKESVLNCLLRKVQHLIYKWGARKIRAKLKKVKMFVPRITRGGNEKP